MGNQNTTHAIDIANKLRLARQERKLSLRELAEKADVSASLLSQIENGKINPTVRSLHSIAEALSLPVNYFFPGEDENNVGPKATSAGVLIEMTASELRTVQAAATADGLDTVFSKSKKRTPKGPVVRSESRATINLQGDVTWARLTPGPEEGIEFLQIYYEVGARSGARLSRHGGREFGLILEGELLVELGFESYLLKPGDSIIFDSETPHRLVNSGDVPMRAIWVIFHQYH